MSYRPAFCRCGQSGFLAPTPAGGASAPLTIFDVIPDADSEPVAPPPRDKTVATHEAAHAVVGHVFGFQIERVTVDGQPCVAWAGSVNDIINPRDRVAIALAGHHGARLILTRHEYRPRDDEVIRTFAVVRELRMGGCDDCAAALACFAAGGAEADDAALLATYRRAEAATIATLREPRVTSAVRVLSGLLMLNGSMSGRNVHDALAAIGLRFASLKINNDPEN